MIPTHSSPTANSAARPKRRQPYVIIRDWVNHKDGVTVLMTNRGRLYIDGRLASKTKGALFIGYPGDPGASRVIDGRIIRSVNEQYEV